MNEGLKDTNGRLDIDDDGLMVIFVKLMLISLYAYNFFNNNNEHLVCHVWVRCGENGDRRMMAYLMTRTSCGFAEYFPL